MCGLIWLTSSADIAASLRRFSASMSALTRFASGEASALLVACGRGLAAVPPSAAAVEWVVALAPTFGCVAPSWVVTSAGLQTCCCAGASAWEGPADASARLWRPSANCSSSFESQPCLSELFMKDMEMC